MQFKRIIQFYIFPLTVQMFCQLMHYCCNLIIVMLLISQYMYFLIFKICHYVFIEEVLRFPFLCLSMPSFEMTDMYYFTLATCRIGDL